MSELSLTLQFQLHRKGVDDDLPGDCSGVRQCYPGHTGPEGEAERGRHSCAAEAVLTCPVTTNGVAIVGLLRNQDILNTSVGNRSLF